MITPTHDAVAIHAYHAWEAEGRLHGRHESHWFAAEAALNRIASPSLVEAAPIAKAAETPTVEAPAMKAPVTKAPASKKAAAPKKASAKAAAPKAALKAVAPLAADKAAHETVLAAAALAGPRAARNSAKGARRPH